MTKEQNELTLEESVHELADSLCFCDTFDERVEGEDRVIWENFEHLSEDDVNEIVDDFAESVQRFINDNRGLILKHYGVTDTVDEIKKTVYAGIPIKDITRIVDYSYMTEFHDCNSETKAVDQPRHIFNSFQAVRQWLLDHLSS